MASDKDELDHEQKWNAEKELQKAKEMTTVVYSLIAAFVFLIIAAFTGSDIFIILLGIALLIAIFTGR